MVLQGYSGSTFGVRAVVFLWFRVQGLGFRVFRV